MRPLLLSFVTGLIVLGAASAQNSGESENAPQLPVGQTFKQFEFPIYQGGKLQSTLYADQAKGITLNRAEATDVKIQVYNNGVVTTTITSPKADLYVADQKMRTKNTVLIERADMEASSQDCDFDLKNKKYLLRTNVKVLLKHFDISMTPANGTAAPASSTSKPTASAPALRPAIPRSLRSNESVLDSPGSYADTNAAPIAPSSPDPK
jgi:lipopolysaccharide export system protein LptC